MEALKTCNQRVLKMIRSMTLAKSYTNKIKVKHRKIKRNVRKNRRTSYRRRMLLATTLCPLDRCLITKYRGVI
jgi:hypothetical protein